ncbi:hypothetical protein Tco_0393857 [Tanacetum coccineum]
MVENMVLEITEICTSPESDVSGVIEEGAGPELMLAQETGLGPFQELNCSAIVGCWNPGLDPVPSLEALEGRLWNHQEP